jgi:hypothetical protein
LSIAKAIETGNRRAMRLSERSIATLVAARSPRLIGRDGLRASAREVVAERLAPGAAAPTTKVCSCLKPSSRCHFASFKAIS